ncbi:MAG: hypothetical protein ACLUD0_06460 [Eubacterium ramulus]
MQFRHITQKMRSKSAWGVDVNVSEDETGDQSAAREVQKNEKENFVIARVALTLVMTVGAATTAFAKD